MEKITLVDDELGDRHRKMTTRQLRENLAEALKYTSRQKGKLILTKNGEERAALVSIEDVKVLDAIDKYDLKAIILDALDDEQIKEALEAELGRDQFRIVLKDRLKAISAAKGKAATEATQDPDGRKRHKVSS